MSVHKLHDARQQRAAVRAQYTDFIDRFEAGWRAVWAEQTGGSVPFDDWFFATDEHGDCPFEVAGGWFLDRPPNPRRG